jgi:hypothetical protein
MKQRQGCLQGLFELFMLNTIFDWLQKRFGLGRGVSCTGCGCGLIMLIIFVIMACSIIFSTDWFRFSWSALPFGF